MKEISNLRYLDECVDRHDRHVRLTLGIVHQIQVYKLFQFQVIRLHAIYNVREKG